MTPHAAILIPSLNRPQRLEAVVENIHTNTIEPHSILFCVSDEESKRILTGLGEWFLDDSDDPDQRYVTRMNKLVHHPLALEAETLFFGSDDVIHHSGWLTEALRVVRRGHAVVVVNDGHNPNGTQALMRADYLRLAVFDAPGDAFHGGYAHNFADTEQHFTAFKRGAYARAMASHVEHLHPLFQSANAMPWDKTYADANKGWDRDSALFHERAQLIDQSL